MQKLSLKQAQEAKGILDGLLDFNLGEKGTKGKEIQLSLSVLEKEVSLLNKERKVLESYKEAQHLQLTKIQSAILAGITEEKIESATLGELTRAYTLLKDKELVMQGKATSITGIVGYLIQLEKEEQLQKEGTVIEINGEVSFTEMEYEESTEEEEEKLPCL